MTEELQRDKTFEPSGDFISVHPSEGWGPERI